MRIAYIAAGAGGMYCGSCIHDNTLASALIKLGHEVALIPTYTPLRTDETNVSIDKIFYGGVNVYLEEKFGLFRRTPWFIDRLFNNPTLLNWLSKKSSTTDAKDLGRLTISVLKGEQGHQKKELDKLISWLKNDFKPDIVQLTNSMFVGMAKELKRALNVPILCAMQGEDIFLDDLSEPYRSEAKKLLRERAQEVDGFIATSQFYADFMAEYVQAPPEKIHVVPLGINLSGHGKSSPVRANHTFVIGYMARICPEKGLHLLVDAVHYLKTKLNLPAIKLKVAGYLGQRDADYLKSIKRKVQDYKLNGVFEYLGEVDRARKVEFINSLHVLSVPTTYKEPKGLFVLEALANGVPVIQPSHGAFPEIIAATGGGLLVEPNSSEAIAQGIHQLYSDKKTQKRLSQQGQAVVHQKYNDMIMAKNTLNVYKQFVQN